MVATRANVSLVKSSAVVEITFADDMAWESGCPYRLG